MMLNCFDHQMCIICHRVLNFDLELEDTEIEWDNDVPLYSTQGLDEKQ